MIPNTEGFNLTSTMRLKIEKAIKELPTKDRNNFNKVFDQVIADSISSYGDPTSENYEKSMSAIGWGTILPIEKAIWLFFDLYHKGKRTEAKVD